MPDHTDRPNGALSVALGKFDAAVAASLRLEDPNWTKAVAAEAAAELADAVREHLALNAALPLSLDAPDA